MAWGGGGGACLNITATVKLGLVVILLTLLVGYVLGSIRLAVFVTSAVTMRLDLVIVGHEC